MPIYCPKAGGVNAIWQDCHIFESNVIFLQHAAVGKEGTFLGLLLGRLISGVVMGGIGFYREDAKGRSFIVPVGNAAGQLLENTLRIAWFFCLLHMPEASFSSLLRGFAVERDCLTVHIYS